MVVRPEMTETQLPEKREELVFVPRPPWFNAALQFIAPVSKPPRIGDTTLSALTRIRPITVTAAVY